MLQMLHLDVSKVDQVLHMGTCVGSGKGHERPPRAVWRHGRRPGGVGDVLGHTGRDVLVQASAAHGRVQRGRSFRRPGASTSVYLFIQKYIF
jgi:hypothetical protein